MSPLFSPVGNTQRLDITTVAERFALAGLGLAVGSTLRMFVDGTSTVFVAFGDSSVAAAVPADGNAANGMPIAPGRETGIRFPTAVTHMSVITATGTATVYLTAGDGV